MRRDRVICISEHGYLLEGLQHGLEGNAVGIPKSAFNFLLSVVGDGEALEDYQPFLRLTTLQRRVALKVQNYAGVIRTPCGTQIEILPKTSNRDTEADRELSRLQLLKMLRSLRESPLKEAGNAAVQHASMPLLEVYITRYLHEVGKLIKRGIRSDYVVTSSNSKYLKGRLLIAPQLRKNVVHADRFFVEYQQYLVDRPVNRLTKSALLLVSRFARSSRNQRLAREYRFAFDAVPESLECVNDFRKARTDRSMAHYREVMAWNRLLLFGQGPTASAGSLDSLSLLYPMERLFEDYVADCLAKNLSAYFPGASRLKTQAAKYHLVEEHNGSPIFQLKPDLIAMAGGKNLCVMDTKWKLLDQGDRSKKYGVSQSDMYQLYAYGHKYLRDVGARQLMLIYPKTETFSQPLPKFHYEDGLTLEIVPFDLSRGELVYGKTY